MSVRYRRFFRFSSALAGLLLLILLCCGAAYAQTDPWAPFETPWFDKLGVSEGLPHSITTAIAQDSRGLIWIGTKGGLVRYDGYRMLVFEMARGDVVGLPDTYVRSLLPLPNGGMLVGTSDGGLARFDPSTGTFHVYPVDANGTSDSKIYGLAADQANGVWIANDRGLDHLDLATNVISHLKTGSETAQRNFSVLQDRAGNLWIGNNNGLFVRSAGSSNFVRPSGAVGTAAAVLANQIWAIQEDREGRLWVGSGQAGAAYRDTDGQWRSVPSPNGSQAGVAQPTVRDFLEIASGAMWIATDGTGVTEYVPGSDHVRAIDNDPAVPSSLPGDSVRALLQDHEGNIWVATDLGVAHTNPNARAAFSLLPSPSRKNMLANNSVHAIYVDTRGRIWLGLGEGLIDVIDLKVGNILHLQLGGGQALRDVQSFAETADGTLWVGAEGVASIDPDTLAIRNTALPALNDKPVLSLQSDGTQLLIGTYEGVYRYDTRTHTLDHARHVASDPTSLANDTVQQIANIDGDWWFSTARGVSIVHDAASHSGFENLRHLHDDPASLPQDYIGSIAKDSKGRIWISTFGGLGVLDRYTRSGPFRFQTIDAVQGLKSDRVSAVLADDRGYVWASMANGVAKIDTNTHAVYNLGTRDGLHIDSYISVAAARAPGGELLFGGLGGLTVVRPYVQSPAVVAPLVITDAMLNGKMVPFGKLPANDGTIVLDRRGHNLRVDYSLLDYQAPMEAEYSYRIDGLDDAWVDIPKGGMPSAIYTNLPHGKYKLRLRVTTLGMQPNTIETDLNVVVKPHWYETALARVIAVLAVIVLFVELVQLRTRYLKRQATQLQRQIDERTHDLRIANQRLDVLASNDALTGVYNRRRFMELVGDERRQARQHSICMAIFDLDHFKQINDNYGHQAGDAVICGAVEIIKQHCRQGDLVGRYGGEEFVMCLPDTSLQGAHDTVERIRKLLASTVMTHDGRSLSVTVSVGVAVLREDEPIEQWLSRADKALYEAKHGGRNRSVTAA